jgi:2',3'-cyclic-nucleotide 2'-phosphodiesterase (5'-nucleotidase family)
MLQKLFIKRFIHLIFLLAISACSKMVSQGPDPQLPYEIGKGNLTAEDAKIEAIIAPYREPLQKSMAETLCYSDANATKELPEGSLGSMITDILRNEISIQNHTPIDICFLNHGGLRVEWPKGAIVRSMVFELMPFENQLQIIQMNVNQVEGMLKLIAAKGGSPISGIRMEIENGQLKSWSVDGDPKKEKALYNVLTSDYLVNGGDSYLLKHEGEIKLLQGNLKVRDGIEAAIKRIHANGKILKPMKDGRIQKITTP